MEDAFRAKVRTAATAAWWTLLVAAGFVTVQWLGYRAALSARPEWLRALWGPDATWDTIQTTWFYALVALKLSLWPLALVAIWLTLWARQLRPRGPGA
jgi:hypothetical protein